MATLPPIVSDPAQIRTIFLSLIKNGLYNIGITNANVSEGSDYYVLGETMATQLSTLFNYMLIAGDNLMPDTTTGADLDRWLTNVGLTRKPAGGSTGAITLITDYTVLIPLNAELTSATGVRYNVTQGGTYATGASVPIASVDVGAQTNLEIGEVLTWSNPPFGVQTTAAVSQALIGGIDLETDDVARQRLLDRLAHAPAAANWQWIANLAETTTSAVQKAFVFPAANGPSTVHIAVAAPPADGTKSREVDPLVMNQIVTPTILGNMPEYVETIVTSVIDVPVDIAFNLTIPLAKSASSSISGPGTGNGWLDASPFPRVDQSTHFFVPVTSVSNSTNFTIDSPPGFDPVSGINRIMWIDRTTWTVNTATINSFSGSGPYVLTINNPFVGIAQYDWIFPACQNAQVYIDAILNGMSLMGPGEKEDIGVNPIASRKPRPSDSFPANLDSVLLRYLINSGEEVETATYYYRSTLTPGTASDSTQNVTVIPAYPVAIANAPNILIPRNIGLYPPFPLQ